MKPTSYKARNQTRRGKTGSFLSFLSVQVASSGAGGSCCSKTGDCRWAWLRLEAEAEAEAEAEEEEEGEVEDQSTARLATLSAY